jgi:hypothetical protein
MKIFGKISRTANGSSGFFISPTSEACRERSRMGRIEAVANIVTGTSG